MIIQKYPTQEQVLRMFIILLQPPSGVRQIIPNWALIAEEHPTLFLITHSDGKLPTYTTDLEHLIITNELEMITHALTAP